MASALLSDQWSFLPGNLLRPRFSRNSILSSKSSSESSKYSIRTGSYPAAYSAQIPQDVTISPPTPPRRTSGSLPNLPPRKSGEASSSLVSAAQGPGSLRLHKSNYHRIRSKGFLFQRRALAVFSILALCVSVCVALLIGYTYFGTYGTSSCDNTCRDSHKEISPDSPDNDRVILEVSKIFNADEEKKYKTNQLEKEVFGQVHFQSQEITKCNRVGELKHLKIHIAEELNVRNVFTNENGFNISSIGWYFVYSSLNYKITTVPDTNTEHWKHQITRQSSKYNRKPEHLSIASYNCNGECVNTNRSSYTAGLFHLCRGDVIAVKVCGDMHVYGDPESTYLGLFITSEFPEQSC